MKSGASVIALLAIFMWPDVVPWLIVVLALVYMVVLVFRE
nr:MAG: hypothetical protein [Bacteriophage sp.]